MVEWPPPPPAGAIPLHISLNISNNFLIDNNLSTWYNELTHSPCHALVRANY